MTERKNSLEIKEIQVEYEDTEEKEVIQQLLLQLELNSPPCLYDCSLRCFTFSGKAIHKALNQVVSLFGFVYFESLFDIKPSFLKDVTWMEMNRIKWRLEK